ncbi:MAG: hypothetical protein LBE13_11685 [Bacteroidales bacterium]|nr:hypothetical protein [Bacteroidales bacterium]
MKFLKKGNRGKTGFSKTRQEGKDLVVKGLSSKHLAWFVKDVRYAKCKFFMNESVLENSGLTFA